MFVCQKPFKMDPRENVIYWQLMHDEIAIFLTKMAYVHVFSWTSIPVYRLLLLITFPHEIPSLNLTAFHEIKTTQNKPHGSDIRLHSFHPVLRSTLPDGICPQHSAFYAASVRSTYCSSDCAFREKLHLNFPSLDFLRFFLPHVIHSTKFSLPSKFRKCANSKDVPAAFSVRFGCCNNDTKQHWRKFPVGIE